MTENYALLGGSIKIDPTDFDTSLLARIAELTHTRVHDLLPWNWKATRHQTVAAQAGSHITPRPRTRRVAGRPQGVKISN